MDGAAASLSGARTTLGSSIASRLTPLRLIAAVTIAAIVVRAVGLGQRPLWLDEAYSAWFSSRSFHELWTVVPTYEPHPPFYYSLLKLWRALFGGDALALRGFSVALSVITVPLMFAAAQAHERLAPSGRPLLRRGVAAVLAACSPMLILLDQEARPYPLLIFAYAVATLGLLRLLDEFRHGAGRWTSWALVAVGTEIALWAHGLGLLYALCLAGALAPAWLNGADRRRLTRGLVSAIAVLLLYLPCLAMIATRVGDWGTGWISWEPELMLQLIGLYSVPYEALTAGSAVVALAMLLLLKRAIQTALAGKGWSADRALLVLWWGPPLLAVAISALLIPVFLPRTLAATLIPAYLLFAAAVARSDSPHERLGLTAALCIILPVTSVQVALREPTERWKDVAGFLARNVGPDDRVWLYPNDSALPLTEAANGVPYRIEGVPGDYPATAFKGPIRAGSPAVVSLTSEQAERIARDPAIAAVPTIWLVTRQSMLFDPAGDLPAALSRVRQRGPAEDWGYISVQPYTLRPSPSFNSATGSKS